MTALNAASLIQLLELEAHIEGGYFRRTYTSANKHDQQACCSSIYYLLCTDSPLGHLHKNSSDIMHYHHSGAALKYTLVSPDGSFSEQLLGGNIHQGEQPQLLVPAHYWKATELLPVSDTNSADYALISEVVIPEFRFQDMELATTNKIKQQHPQLCDRLLPLIKPKQTKN